MLANVIFYLKDTLQVWFKTHKEEITSSELFGSPVGDKMVAQKQPASCAQTPTESYLTYNREIQEVIRNE